MDRVREPHTTERHIHSVLGTSRALSLKWHLLLLVAGSLLPIVVFAVVIVHQLSSQAEAASERRTLLAARNLSQTVEREISGTVRTLQAIAASEQLDQPNLKGFYDQAKRAAQTQPTWLNVVLLDPNGQQLVNIRQPFGAPLASANEPESVRRVVQTHQPTVGDLAMGRMDRNLAFPVRVPVIRDGKLRYILTAAITPKALASVVASETSMDGEWTRTVVDSRGIVVARTRNPERFVGKSGTPSFLKRIRESTEDVYRDSTLEGVKVYLAFSRIRGSRWTVAVTVPVEVIQAPAQRAMVLVIGSGVVLLLASGIGALILSRQIAHSITSIAQAAEALAQGERPQIRSSSIREVVVLGESLQLSANLLSQREQERNDNLARAELARQEAEAANHIKDEFLAVLSHELRSPLNPILGWAKLLRTGKLDAAKTAHALETIERNAKLQTQLIEDLLDIARILRGKLNLTITPVNLALTIEAALETVRLSAEAKSIQIQMQLDPTVEFIAGDAARLQQVIWNLLSNAVKFTPNGGQIIIRLEEVGEQAQIQVSDTGQGISLEFLPHVFDHFRQADSTTTRKFGGLGLGLAIVRQLVEMHGGTVQAASPGEGQGATFTVRLPLPQEANPKIGVDRNVFPEASVTAHPLQGVRVLLVDDEADTRELMAFVLETAGATVMAVPSAIAALNKVSQTDLDILVSDIGMPEMNGYTLIQQIRKLLPEQGGQVPAIALTAYVGEIDQQQAIAAGFQRHIAKPVEPNTLVEAIIALLKQSTVSSTQQ